MEVKNNLDTDMEPNSCGKRTHDPSISGTGRDDAAAASERNVRVMEVVRGGVPAGKGNDEEDVPLESRVPDGGWGWMVALGTFIITMLFFSMPYCFGILFSGYLLENGASSTSTAWIYNLFLVSWSLCKILINPLSREFGQRTVGFISVSMAALSIILSGFSLSVSFLYFSFSLVGGVSTGLIIGIAYMVLPPYFDRRSGQANTFLVIGPPATQMVMAPLIRYLLAVYCLKGAALIHGAILLNGLIAMSFFHPVKWHLKPSSGEKPRPQQDALQALMPHDNTSPTVSTETPCRVLVPEVSNLVPQNRSIQKLRRSLSGSSSSVMSVGSDVSVGLVFLSDETEKSAANVKARGAKAFFGTLLRVAERTKSDAAVLRQFRCVILAVTLLLTQTTSNNFIMLLPFVARAADHSLQDAALCISFVGITNLVTRLVVSPLSDCKWFSIRFSIMLGYLLRALAITVASLSSELWQFMASGVVFGLGMAFSLSMYNLVIVHYMGRDNLGPTIGIIGLVTAFGYLTLGPLIGVVRDATNSYSTTLYLMAAMDLLSMGLWFLMPAAQAMDARRKHRPAQDVS